MANFSAQFWKGVKGHSTAFNLIRKHNLWSFFIWPIVLALVVLWAASSGINSVTEFSVAYLKDLLWDVPAEDGFWEQLVGYAVWFIFKILFFYTYFTLNKYVVFIVLSPILAIVSERVDQKITGRNFPFSMGQLVQDVLRGIAVAFRNLFLEYTFTLALLLLSLLVPVIAPFYPFIIFFIAAYFYGFAFLDYNSERYRLSYKDSVQLIRKNKGLATGLGSVFSLLFFLPFLGGILAPIWSCIAATVVYLDQFKPSFASEKNATSVVR